MGLGNGPCIVSIVIERASGGVTKNWWRVSERPDQRFPTGATHSDQHDHGPFLFLCRWRCVNGQTFRIPNVFLPVAHNPAVVIYMGKDKHESGFLLSSPDIIHNCAMIRLR